MIKSEIPIQNIYYMLSFAYKNLKINETIFKESVEFDNIYDLFARILINALNALIKRGFVKDYVLKNGNLKTPRGKINIGESIRRGTLMKKSLNCQFDEFEDNILFNQIIKTTINKLISSRELNNSYKRKLMKFRPYFDGVDEITIGRKTFKALNWNRNNGHYNLIISICELVWLFEIPDSSTEGKIAFKDFIKNHEKELAALFENFVYNFYKRNLKGVRVHRPNIGWDLDDDFDNIGFQYLPNMRTDIVLENDENQLIIDTKFYRNIMTSYFDTKKLSSGNLYQIMTYVNNSDFNGNKKGMLLYASLGEDIDYQYRINGKTIYVKTLDLNQNWKAIESRLIEIANLLVNKDNF